MVNAGSSHKPPTEFEQLKGRVGYLEGWLRAITGHTQENSQRLSDLEGQTRELSRLTDERFKKADERMENLDRRVTDAQYSADRAQERADSSYELGYSAHARITNTNNNLKIIGSIGGVLIGTYVLFRHVLPGIQEVLTYNYCKLSANLTSPNCLDYNIPHLTEQGIQPSENYAVGQLSLLILSVGIAIGGYYLHRRKNENELLEQAINS